MKKQKKHKASQLKSFRETLKKKRDDLLAIVQRKKHGELPETEIGDEVDSASASVEKEMLFELTNNEKIMLDAIEASLRKFEKGKYGYCEKCSKTIPLKRLKAMPWARYCLPCQKKFESL
ncbi:MAG: TraR/DksA C4-type zinc finger protein [Elusimicrobiota bacterium]